MSVNTLDDNFWRDMDCVCGVEERLSTLRIIHENGIYTII